MKACCVPCLSPAALAEAGSPPPSGSLPVCLLTYVPPRKVSSPQRLAALVPGTGWDPHSFSCMNCAHRVRAPRRVGSQGKG